MSFSISKSLDLVQFSSLDPQRIQMMRESTSAEPAPITNATGTNLRGWKGTRYQIQVENSHKKINSSKETDRNSGTMKTQHH